jgi:hypothetical protein
MIRLVSAAVQGFKHSRWCLRLTLATSGAIDLQPRGSSIPAFTDPTINVLESHDGVVDAVTCDRAI